MRGAHLRLVLAYLAFVSLGLPDTVVGVAWPSVRGEFGISQAGLGLVLAAGVVGYFTAGLFAGRLVTVMGLGKLLTCSTALVAVGLIGYATSPMWRLFLPAGVLIGLGSGAIDTGLNAYAANHLPARHLNWLHACWSVGATIGPSVMTAVLVGGSSFRQGYALIAGAMAMMALAFLTTQRLWRIQISEHSKKTATTAPSDTDGDDARRRVAALQIVTFFVYTGLEATAGQWCFTFLREARGLSVPAAGGWTTAFWGSLLVGRLVFGLIIDRVGPDRLLRAATVCAVVGATALAGTTGIAGQVGLVLLGIGLAPVYPTLVARTPARLGPRLTAQAIGFQVSAATLGTVVFPGAIGLWIAAAGANVVPVAVVTLTAVLLGLHEALLRMTR